jgi:hypothetical protein
MAEIDFSVDDQLEVLHSSYFVLPEVLNAQHNSRRISYSD